MRKILLLIPAFICPVLILCQTLTPIYVASESVDIAKIQFINPKNGLTLKSKTQEQLIHINKVLPDTIKLIIPFKNGVQIVFDTIETKYFNNCVINVSQNPNSDPACRYIQYGVGHRIIIRRTGSNCGKQFNQITISSNYDYYYKMTKDLKIDLSKRYKLLRKNLKKRFPGRKIPVW